MDCAKLVPEARVLDMKWDVFDVVALPVGRSEHRFARNSIVLASRPAQTGQVTGDTKEERRTRQFGGKKRSADLNNAIFSVSPRFVVQKATHVQHTTCTTKRI